MGGQNGEAEGGKGAKIRAVGGYARVGGGLALGGGKKNRSDVGEGGKRAVRERRRRGGERKGLRGERGERKPRFREISKEYTFPVASARARARLNVIARHTSRVTCHESEG